MAVGFINCLSELSVVKNSKVVFFQMVLLFITIDRENMNLYTGRSPNVSLKLFIQQGGRCLGLPDMANFKPGLSLLSRITGPEQNHFQVWKILKKAPNLVVNMSIQRVAP